MEIPGKTVQNLLTALGDKGHVVKRERHWHQVRRLNSRGPDDIGHRDGRIFQGLRTGVGSGSATLELGPPMYDTSNSVFSRSFRRSKCFGACRVFWLAQRATTEASTEVCHSKPWRRFAASWQAI
jgi:hypothetical protein